MMKAGGMVAATLIMAGGTPALAQSEVESLRAEVAAAKAQIDQQKRQLDEQESRLRALEQRLAGAAPNVTSPGANSARDTQVATRSPTQGADTGPAPQGPVGQAPALEDRPPEVAVLGREGSVVTRRGQLLVETSLDYARADRNRALFRGIEVVESVLVGVFDINESRQDVITTSASLRYGLTDRLEFGVRVPFVYRADRSVLVPVQGSTPDDAAATIDSSANGRGIGDIELSARYQLTSARVGWPYLIGNLQVVIPTGTDPFSVPRNALGEAQKAATGSGFLGVSPSITAIVPTDPAVLFGTIGYTYNRGSRVNAQIPPVIIDFVDPGDAVSFSGGIGIALNQRTSFNLGYAHSWSFGTKTRTRLIESPNAAPVTSTARDLQIGRLLFGTTYRVNDRTSINWSVELGATDDATDVRTSLRIPFVLLRGR